MQQLGAIVLMPGFAIAMGVIMGKRHQRTVLKIEG